MTSRDKLGMSLDDIIRLNRQKRGGGSVTSRGAQRSRRGSGNTSPRGASFRGRGRGGANIIRRGGQNLRGRGGTNVHRGGRPIVRGRGDGFRRGRSNIRSRGGLGNRARSMSRDRVRGNPSIRSRGKRGGGDGANFRGRAVMNQVGSSRRGLQESRTRGRGRGRGRGFRGNQGIASSFRSDQIVRQQTAQQKLNRARTLKQLAVNTSVSGASDFLTVCIPNDLAAKRRRQRSSSVPRFSSVNRDTLLGSSNVFANQPNFHRGGASSIASSTVLSREGSVVTTINRQHRASSVGRNRNRRSSSVGRNGFIMQPQRPLVVEQHVSRSGLNLELQKEIAAIQGKTYSPSAASTSTAFSNGSDAGLGLSEFRPVPTLTGTTLNERFS